MARKTDIQVEPTPLGGRVSRRRRPALFRGRLLLAIGVAIAVMVSSTATASSIEQGASGLDYVPLTEPPKANLPSYYGGSAQVVGLEEARDIAGPLLIPGYLPEGFILYRTSVGMGRDVTIGFSPWPSPMLTALAVRLVRYARPRVMDGFVEETRIGRRPGLLVHGAWVRQRGTDGISTDSMNIEWDPDFSTSVVVERDDWTVIIVGYERGIGEKYWADEELIKIAESLRPY